MKIELCSLALALPLLLAATGCDTVEDDTDLLVEVEDDFTQALIDEGVVVDFGFTAPVDGQQTPYFCNSRGSMCYETCDVMGAEIDMYTCAGPDGGSVAYCMCSDGTNWWTSESGHFELNFPA